MLVIEFYCAQRNIKQEEFYENWSDLQELIEWREQNQENVVYRDWYTVVQSNVMDSSASSNALIQDNSEGLFEKNDIHMQRKNYKSGNTEEK